MNWRCRYLPWHRFPVSFFPIPNSPNNCEVYMCSCGREYAVNHVERQIIPWDDETKAFYRMLGKL